MKSENREKTLLKNTAIISLGIICTKLITFFLLPLYTGILTTEEYGIVDLLNTLVSLTLPIVTFQIEQAVFRELIEVRQNKKSMGKIISSSLFSVIGQCIIFAILLLIISPLINNDYKYYLFFNIIASIFASLFLQISRGIGDTKRYSIASFVTAIFTIIFNILFLVGFKMKVNGMLLGTLIGQISCVIYLFIFLKLYNYISYKLFDKKMVLKLWKYSVPLIPNAISWWVFGSSDRVIVSMFLGLSMNGILSVSSKFSAMYVTLYNIFDRSWIESISMHINDADIADYFNKMMNKALKIFASIMMVIISVMPFAYSILINEKFSYGYMFVPILMIAAFFTVCQGMIAVIYAGKKDTKAIAKTSIVAAILNIVIHLSLIKFIGLYAAVVSTLASYFVIFIYRLYDINKRYMKIYLEKKFIIFTTLYMMMLLFLYYNNVLLMNVLSIIFTIAYVFVINYDTIKGIVLFIKKKVG